MKTSHYVDKVDNVCSFDYQMISTLCYLRISCYPGEHDRVCYGGIGHQRVLGEGAYNSRHAYQQLDMLAPCQPSTCGRFWQATVHLLEHTIDDETTIRVDFSSAD